MFTKKPKCESTSDSRNLLKKKMLDRATGIAVNLQDGTSSLMSIHDWEQGDRNQGKKEEVKMTPEVKMKMSHKLLSFVCTV